MEVGEIIALIGLSLFWVGTLTTMWVKLNIKLERTDLRIENAENDLDAHIKWGEQQQNLISKNLIILLLK